MPVSIEALNQGVDLMRGELKNAPVFTAKKLATWAALFSDWSNEQFLMAATEASRSLVFFPTVGELRRTAGGTKEDAQVDCDEAWELVRAAIRRHGKDASLCARDVNGDTAALWVVARMGADAIGMMTEDDRAIRAAEFRRLYAVAKARNYGDDYLVGKFETDNRARGLDTTKNPVLLGRADMPELPPALPHDGPQSIGQVVDIRPLVKPIPSEAA